MYTLCRLKVSPAFSNSDTNLMENQTSPTLTLFCLCPKRAVRARMTAEACMQCKGFSSDRTREETLKAVWNWFESFVRSGLTTPQSPHNPALITVTRSWQEKEVTTRPFPLLGGISKRNRSCLIKSDFSWCGRWTLNMQSTLAPPTVLNEDQQGCETGNV